MAAYISFQPTDFFNSKLYTGTGAELAVTGVGFQPDLVWGKSRNHTYEHQLTDAVRGTDSQLSSNSTAAEATGTEVVTSFDADGFTVGVDSVMNYSGKTYAAWNWKAGTTSGIAGSPSITPSSYSFNATSGFSIIQYTGTGANATLPHGLGVAPSMIIVKNASVTNDWNVYHVTLGNTKRLFLNTYAVPETTASAWNDTSPTSSLFSIGTNTNVNQSTSTMVAYCFAPKKGYSKFGSYTGNSNVDGSFIYTGFRPAFVMVKRYDSGSEDWNMWNDKALGYNVDNNKLLANLVTAESTSDEIDLLSNGFKWRTTNGGLNDSGGSYIYAAFAEFPLVSSNSKTGTAR